MIAKRSMFFRGLSWKRELKRVKNENWQLSCLCNKHHATIIHLTSENKRLGEIVSAIGNTSATYDPCQDLYRIVVNIDAKTLITAQDTSKIVRHFVKQLELNLQTLLTKHN